MFYIAMQIPVYKRSYKRIIAVVCFKVKFGPYQRVNLIRWIVSICQSPRKADQRINQEKKITGCLNVFTCCSSFQDIGLYQL